MINYLRKLSKRQLLVIGALVCALIWTYRNCSCDSPVSLPSWSSVTSVAASLKSRRVLIVVGLVAVLLWVRKNCACNKREGFSAEEDAAAAAVQNRSNIEYHVQIRDGILTVSGQNESVSFKINGYRMGDGVAYVATESNGNLSFNLSLTDLSIDNSIKQLGKKDIGDTVPFSFNRKYIIDVEESSSGPPTSMSSGQSVSMSSGSSVSMSSGRSGYPTIAINDKVVTVNDANQSVSFMGTGFYVAGTELYMTTQNNGSLLFNLNKFNLEADPSLPQIGKGGIGDAMEFSFDIKYKTDVPVLSVSSDTSVYNVSSEQGQGMSVAKPYSEGAPRVCYYSGSGHQLCVPTPNGVDVQRLIRQGKQMIGKGQQAGIAAMDELNKLRDDIKFTRKMIEDMSEKIDRCAAT